MSNELYTLEKLLENQDGTETVNKPNCYNCYYRNDSKYTTCLEDIFCDCRATIIEEEEANVGCMDWEEEN